MRKIRLFKKIQCFGGDERPYNVDLIKTIPRETYLEQLVLSRIEWRTISDKRPQIAVLSCRSNCRDYEARVRAGCNLAHLVNKSIKGTTLAELHAQADDPWAFRSVSLLVPNFESVDCAGAWVFKDFSARVYLSCGKIRRTIVCKNIFELAFNNQLRKYPEGHAGRDIHELLAKSYAMEMVAFMASQASGLKKKRYTSS